MNVSRGLGLVVAAAAVLIIAVPVAWADRDHGRREHGRDEGHGRDHGLVLDHRYNHNRYYPRRGMVFPMLPRGYRVIPHRGGNYYFSAGVWYRPLGLGFTVVMPPIGLVVPVLPPFYTTVWVRSVPYYYADGVYYVWSAPRQGYVISDSPLGAEVSATAPAQAGQLFIYPKNGQSQAQQENDRYECHLWSVSQSGYDPTRPPVDADMPQQGEKGSAYRRAMEACLSGRGYSVK